MHPDLNNNFKLGIEKWIEYQSPWRVELYQNIEQKTIEKNSDDDSFDFEDLFNGAVDKFTRF